jgi:hypothetical protein
MGVVGTNAEKCLNLNFSTNPKPYANLHKGFNQGSRLKKKVEVKIFVGENSRGTVPLMRFQKSLVALMI